MSEQSEEVLQTPGAQTPAMARTPEAPDFSEPAEEITAEVVPAARESHKERRGHADAFAAKVYAEGGENEGVEIQRAKFPALREEACESPLEKIDYLKDVDLEASVELGSSTLNVERILKLGPGAVIELNQAVGDPVRLMINGSFYAFGEVVVIGEKFGVRITQIMHSA